MSKVTYLIYKVKSKYLYSNNYYIGKSRFNHKIEGQISVGPTREDELIGSSNTEEDCEKFINNLNDQGTFYWVKGIVKMTFIEP